MKQKNSNHIPSNRSFEIYVKYEESRFGYEKLVKVTYLPAYIYSKQV